MKDKTRILIVEDEAIVAEDIKIRLELLGYQVAGMARSAENALALAEKELPDLFLMDIKLEREMDGIQAADIIRKRWHLPVIFLTAYSEDAIISCAKLTEPFGYLLKPFEDRELKTTIEMALYKHRIENELRMNKEFSENLIKSLGDGLLVINKDGSRSIVNEALCNMTGFTKEELQSDRLDFLIWPPEHSKEIHEAFESMMTGNSKEIDLIFKRKNGQRFPVIVSPSYMKNEHGEIVNNIVIIKDITQRNRAKKELEEVIIKAQNEKNKSESIIAALGDAISIQDTDFKVLYQNKIHQEILGDHKGRYCYREYEHRENICDGCPVDRSFKDGKIHSEERSIIKDGQKLYFDIKSSPLRDSTGKIIAGIEVVRDISERKKAEDKLRRSEERFRKLIETEPECVKLLTEDNILVDMNPAGLGMIEADSLVQVAGKSILGVIDKEYKEAFVDVGRRVFQGKSASLEFRITGLKGTKRWLETHAVPLRDDNGKIKSLLAVTRDITERKHAQEERMHLIAREQAALAKAEAARKLDRMKSMFIASTSHELRTPLNSIIGFTSLILDGASGELNPDQKEQLSIVHSSGKHLLALINDILDLSMIEGGRARVVVCEFNLAQVVNEAVSNINVILNEKNIGLKVGVSDIKMRSDRIRLLQCIINLLNNAVKYTEKGSVEITAKVIDNNVELSVIDTGIGIKTGDIPKLFSPFVRLQSHLTLKTSGTGLGLYLVKKLANDFLNGDVEVESESGKGSKFTLRIPVELDGEG